MDNSITNEPKIHKEQKVEKDNKDPIYTNKISEEEYNKQKDDYTQKALKELSEQMKTFEKPKENKEENKKSKSAFNIINTNKKINTDIIKINTDKKINNNDSVDDDDDNDNDDDDNNGNDGSESDYDTNLDNTKASINLIVQHVENKQKKRKVSHQQFKNQDTSMSDSIYAQHEVDMRTIQLLKDKMNELKIENADLDSKKHYLTLDLNNAQCEVNDLKKQVSYLKDQLISHKQFIKQMKKYDDDFAKMLKLVVIVVTILLLLLYLY